MPIEATDQRVANILECSDAPHLVSFLQTTLEREQQRRQQFYDDVHEDQKAEFINGEVVIHSPVKKQHTDATKWITALTDIFVRIFDLGYVGFEKVMIALTRNDYEPDVVFFKKEKSRIFEDGTWKYPAPDFVVEVLSESTADNDRKLKFKDYEATKCKNIGSSTLKKRLSSSMFWIKTASTN